MKICTKCKRRRQNKSFNKNSTRSDGLSNVCRDCANSYDKERYVKNKGSHNELMKQRNAEYRDRYRKKINEIKSSGCTNCEEKEPCCIDFHHIDESNKLGDVATMAAHLKKWEVVQKEIDKCVLLCANCHRKLHAGLLRGLKL